MAQCESKVFFPDDPGQRPQFTDCPRQAETARHASRQTTQGVLTSTVKLCGKCAKVWDGQDTHCMASASRQWSESLSAKVAMTGTARPRSDAQHTQVHPTQRL
jgi:hypothetical protein